eukprot:COSAG06_NODE_21008_length_773_cov_1.133531_2_plen_22_part_01
MICISSVDGAAIVEDTIARRQD